MLISVFFFSLSRYRSGAWQTKKKKSCTVEIFKSFTRFLAKLKKLAFLTFDSYFFFGKIISSTVTNDISGGLKLRSFYTETSRATKTLLAVLIWHSSFSQHSY